jgi:hypothetical protein
MTRKPVVFITGFALAIMLAGSLLLPSAREQAKARVTLVTLSAVAAASRSYFTNCGSWPRTINELTTTNNPKQAVFLYVSTPPLVDGWGNPLTYIPFDPTSHAGCIQSRRHYGNGAEAIYEMKFQQ